MCYSQFVSHENNVVFVVLLLDARCHIYSETKQALSVQINSSSSLKHFFKRRYLARTLNHDFVILVTKLWLTLALTSLYDRLLMFQLCSIR